MSSLSLKRYLALPNKEYCNPLLQNCHFTTHTHIYVIVGHVTLSVRSLHRSQLALSNNISNVWVHVTITKYLFTKLKYT